MRRLGRLTAKLAQQRKRWDALLNAALPIGDHEAPVGHKRLVEVSEFGSNPGNLRMFTYVPKQLAPSPALVVVLHGCTQTAAGYDQGSGWSTLADRYGFALLLPQQQPANNPKTCFTWFDPRDTARDCGEALSIRQMVEHMVAVHDIDRTRIFVNGLSAGGAMAAVMLATYPDVFAGGAIIAGLPYGCASNVQEAFESMFTGRTLSAREWGDLVRSASPHRGPWPRVSIWHGTADTTVLPTNAQEIVKQWTDVHGLEIAAAMTDRVDGYPRRVWRGPDGMPLVEQYTITGMAHGTPLATGSTEVPHGTVGPFLLEAGIASSYHIAKFWGLTTGISRLREDADAAFPVHRVAAPLHSGPDRQPEPPEPHEHEPGKDRPDLVLPINVQAVITKALRVAGLLRH